MARCLAQLLSSLVMGLGYVWIGLDSHEQGWHDQIAGTYVVRKEHVRPWSCTSPRKTAADPLT